MEPRRLEQLVFLLCCFAAITCRLHALAQAQTTLQHPTGAVGRILSEAGNRSASALSVRTRRIDPLDGLRKYEGGYNITDKHYWSSTIFTGRSGYMIAALWVICGVIFLGTILVSKIFCTKRKERYTDFDYFLERYQILTVILCIILAVFVM